MTTFKLAWPCKGLLFGWALGCSASVVLAQTSDPGGEGAVPAGPAPTLWVEPMVSASMNLSSNGNLVPVGETAEQTLEVSTGVRVVVNRPSVRGDVDYTLSRVNFAQGTSRNDFRHELDANATFNLVDQRVFIDASSLVSNETLSAFRSQQGVLLSDANRTQASRFRISPYVVGTFGPAVDYQLRYSLQRDANDTGNRADVDTRETSFQVGSKPAGRGLGWSLDGYSQQVDYAITQTNKLNKISGSLKYSVTPEMIASLSAGSESNNVLTAQQKSYTNVGLNLEWRPSPRSRLVVGMEDRFFGNGHSVALEHRTGRTVWRLFSTRRIDSETPLDTAVASLGSAGGVLETLLAPQFPNDPVGLARAVSRYLSERGISPDQPVTQNFFTSAVTLEDRLEGSVAYVGVRDTVSLLVARVRSKRLGTAINLGDDFDNNATIDQLGILVRYDHRLTPLTTFNASISSQRNTGTATNAYTRLSSAVAGLTTRFAPRTTGSVQLRYTRFTAVVNPYDETAIAGVITHRF